MRFESAWIEVRAAGGAAPAVQMQYARSSERSLGEQLETCISSTVRRELPGASTEP